MTKAVWVVRENHLDSFARRKQTTFSDKQEAYNYYEKLQEVYGEWVRVRISQVFVDEDDPLENNIDLFDERFDGVAFNGLVDGAGEFPLWEDDSRKL